jgi:hypothetical protein
MASVTGLASVAARVQKRAAAVTSRRRAHRAAEWAEFGWSTYARPKQLTYDLEVAYASQACAALYTRATGTDAVASVLLLPVDAHV